ncbi:MAG: thioredoxin family protein [Woeseiaceae bacterium]
MAATESTMLELGTTAPDFSLPTPSGDQIRLADFEGSAGLVVAFICNHCPFVKLIREGLADFAREYSAQGIEMIAINSNDFANYGGDAPEKMQDEINEFGYTFPYVYDESQEIAKAYRAACTPDFYLFDADRKLVYRGRFDGATPGNGVAVTGKELRAAADALLEGNSLAGDQVPSIGCNIKWKAGNEPDYF